jgi:hypothetical protein
MLIRRLQNWQSLSFFWFGGFLNELAAGPVSRKIRGFGPEHSLPLVCRILLRARNALLVEVHSFVFFSTLPTGHGQEEKVKWLCPLVHLNRAVERSNRLVPMVVAVLGQTEGVVVVFNIWSSSDSTSNQLQSFFGAVVARVRKA